MDPLLEVFVGGFLTYTALYFGLRSAFNCFFSVSGCPCFFMYLNCILVLLGLCVCVYVCVMCVLIIHGTLLFPIKK